MSNEIEIFNSIIIDVGLIGPIFPESIFRQRTRSPQFPIDVEIYERNFMRSFLGYVAMETDH